MPDPRNKWKDRLEQQEFGGDQVHPKLSAADCEAVFQCQRDLNQAETQNHLVGGHPCPIPKSVAGPDRAGGTNA